MTSSPRIASLLASATEIACALGLRDHLVGRSHECDYPADISSLPILSSFRVDPTQTGAHIDHQVRDVIAQGLSIYEVDVEGLKRVRPDLILTQDHCEVCAVSLSDVEHALCQMTDQDTTVCTLHPNTLADVVRDFQRVADAADVPERGRHLVDTFQMRLEQIKQRHVDLAKPTVALLEWIEPPMIAGGWMPELAKLAGMQPVIVNGPDVFRTVDWNDIRSADPDVVVILPCGYDMQKSQQEMQQPDVRTALTSLRATRQGRCYVADGNHFFNRPGPRLVESTEILAAIGHPDLNRNLRGAHRNWFQPWVG